MKYQVELTEEADEFLESLTPKIEAKARRAIDLLKEFGYLLSEPHSKKLKQQIQIYYLKSD
jgi:mRNA-degrading endonuclease RelE of RelBE toxin-antitoxin system